MLAGWLIALMIWLLRSARSARLWVIMLLTYAVAVGGFSHIIAGSVEAAYAMFVGKAWLGDYVFRFLRNTFWEYGGRGHSRQAWQHARSRPSGDA